jgi:hypothetical protein
MPKHYQVAEGDDLLDWADVSDRLEKSRNYWLATTRPDGRPHVTPVWGAWLDGALYLDGIFTSRWARNLTTNPRATAHLESGNKVVIVDGIVDDVVPPVALADRIVAAFAEKYVEPLPQASRGIYRLRANSVRAWTRFPHDATVWRFNIEGGARLENS